jgi:hypothetical protein
MNAPLYSTSLIIINTQIVWWRRTSLVVVHHFHLLVFRWEVLYGDLIIKVTEGLRLTKMVLFELNLLVQFTRPDTSAVATKRP